MSDTNSHSDRPELEEIRRRLERAWRGLQRKRRYASLLAGMEIAAGGFLFYALLEFNFYLQAWAKGGILAALLAGSVVAGMRLWRQPGGSDSAGEGAFRQFYLDFSESRNLPALKHALDLDLRPREGESTRLTGPAIRRNLASLNPANLDKEIKAYLSGTPVRHLLIRHTAGAGFSLVLLLGFVLLFGSAAQRALHFWETYQEPNPFSYRVIPGDTALEQGEPFEPLVVFGGERPEEVTLAFKTDAEESYRRRPSRPNRPQTGAGSSADTTRFDPVTLQSDGSYYVEMDGFRSETYAVDLQLRPRFETLEVTALPPSYTGLDSTSQTYPFSRVQAVYGSEIVISGRTNKPVSMVRMRRSSSDSENGAGAAMPADTLLTQSAAEESNSRSFTHRFTLRSGDSLSFALEDRQGLTNRNPFAFTLEATGDRPPWAEISRPEANPEMPSPRPLTVAWEAGDDFGLREAALEYELRKAFTENAREGSIPLEIGGSEGSGELEWDIPSLDVGARDELTFRVRVTDNDPYNGPKEGTSRTVTVRFPSVTENMEALSESEDGVEQSLEDISESQRRMQQQFQQFREQLQQNPETDWEQRQTLQQVEEQRQQMQRQVEELNKKFEEIRRQVEQNDNLSPETRRSYEELQQLMREIDDPGLREALEELQKAMESLSQDQLSEALENYEFNEQRYRERLKRTLELFRNLRLNSNLDQLAGSLEELAERERELEQRNAPDSAETPDSTVEAAAEQETDAAADSTASDGRQSEQADETGDSMREQIRKQESIGEDLEQLRQELDSLSRESSGLPGETQKEVNRLQQNERARMDSLRQMIRRNLENMKDMQPDSARGQNPSGSGRQQLREEQRHIREGLQQSAGAMRGAMQELNQQRRQVNMAALQYILFSLIDLSDNQEELARETEYLTSRSQAFVEKAREERTIRNHFTQLSDSLFSVSTELPGFNNAINRMKAEVDRQLQTAVDMLAERNKSQSTFAQREALGGINRLASRLAALMDNLSRSSGSQQMTMQQFMQQMQEMSGNQQELNKQLQQMINDMQGDRLSRDQMDRLNQLARQQNRIREQLREMQQSDALESGDEVLSDLERLSEDMEQTINDLRGGQADPSVTRRQQNILSRMLSAEQAMQERGKKEEREAATAEETPRAAPPDVTLEELEKRIRSMLNDPEQTRFRQGYQELIQRYFELIRDMQEETDTE